MQAPTPALLRALRAANNLPISRSTTTSLSPKRTCKSLISTRPFTSSIPCHYPVHPALYNNPSSTAGGARRAPNLAPKTRDRGPKSKEETQTDFGAMNVLGNTPPPATAIDACLDDGFHLSNGVKITDGDGVLLIGGEAFGWRPWDEVEGGKLVNSKMQFDVPGNAWGLLELVWPKPELLIVGVGQGMRPLSKETRERIAAMGIRVDVLDTRNAAAQFNLLATERGVGEVAAAMVPSGWRG